MGSAVVIFEVTRDGLQVLIYFEYVATSMESGTFPKQVGFEVLTAVVLGYNAV
jgi:hypothetical protein